MRTFTVIVAGAAASLVVSCSHSPMAVRHAVRRFHFEYRVEIENLPADGKTVNVWVPLPPSDEAQVVSNLKVETRPQAHREGRERVYGNRLVHLEFRAPLEEPPFLRVSFDVERREVSGRSQLPAEVDPARLLRGDRLAPITDEVRRRAEEATAGTERRARVRAIYDSVLADVAYDKSGDGWGRGDVEYVCREGKGNCSDFHSLFIAMARAEGIPAFFEIGFPLPRERKQGEIGGYHCWAWYQDDEGVWRPVDASEAYKNPEQADYFFGTLCANRVAFTRGRDLILEPPQRGMPVNFLIDPYVEVDGAPGGAIARTTFRFQDLTPTVAGPAGL